MKSVNCVKVWNWAKIKWSRWNKRALNWCGIDWMNKNTKKIGSKKQGVGGETLDNNDAYDDDDDNSVYNYRPKKYQKCDACSYSFMMMIFGIVNFLFFSDVKCYTTNYNGLFDSQWWWWCYNVNDYK